MQANGGDAAVMTRHIFSGALAGQRQNKNLHCNPEVCVGKASKYLDSELDKKDYQMCARFLQTCRRYIIARRN